MPRIDPIQLLKCLSVLLSPTGGIKSKDELQRLAKLMTKFSKKLVSKCIYIQILKCTETELLGVFMGSGGWRLVHMWLTESIVAKNWPLVRELLELLLLCPVDIERLKTNNCPKLVKELSKDGNHFAIRALASKLVEQWLKTVKGEIVDQINISDIPQIIADASNMSLVSMEAMNCMETEPSAELQVNQSKDVVEFKASTDELKADIKREGSLDKVEVKAELDESGIKIKEEDTKEKETLPVLKISLKDGKQVISQVDDNDVKSSIKTEKSKHKKEKSSEKSSSSSKSSSSKHSSKSHSSSEKHKSSSHRSSSSPSHHSKDKSKDKEKRSSHSSSSKPSKHSDSSKRSSEKPSSSSSRSSKEEKSSRHSSDSSSGKDNKCKEKDDKNSKDSSLIKTEKTDKPSIHKLGKIPKLSDSKKDKPSISIEVRKPDEPKPKTVKTFHSKFRSHGLEEEVKPPPSRASLLSKKVLPALPPTVSIPKRPSPVHNESPPEKKAKTVEPVEKPGAIKLIPAKPKPMLLLESDMFMDALNASATNKKEPKKRKRRTSGSKDGNSEASPPHAPASPTRDAKSVPPRFYQDTLEAEDDKDKSLEKETENNENAENIDALEKKVTESMETTEPHTITVNGLKGVLCYHKKRGPKKSIKWKPEAELEEVQYFELDETERVNVTKTFTDMKNWERTHEREAFQKGRNLSNEDVMEEKTNWRPLIPIDTEGQVHVDYGKNSKEKDIQAMRQKGTLQPLYFHKSMIPDSALEPEPETHLYSEPSIIPLEDVTGNTDNISDFRNMPWPEPKGNAPPQSTSNVNVAPMFQTNMAQFPNSFPNQFPGVPPFQAATMVPNDWQNAVPPMMANGMAPGPMAAMPPGAMPPGAMPPGMMMPDTMMMGPEMFGAPNTMFGPVPPEGFMMDNMMAPNMFPPDFNMGGGGGVVGGGGAEGFQGGGGYRGNMRGRGAGGGHWRGKGSWDGPPRGRGGHSRGGRKTVCIYFQRKGSCRQGDNCTFLHPGVNGPY